MSNQHLPQHQPLAFEPASLQALAVRTTGHHPPPPSSLMPALGLTGPSAPISHLPATLPHPLVVWSVGWLQHCLVVLNVSGTGLVSLSDLCVLGRLERLNAAKNQVEHVHEVGGAGGGQTGWLADRQAVQGRADRHACFLLIVWCWCAGAV